MSWTESSRGGVGNSGSLDQLRGDSPSPLDQLSLLLLQCNVSVSEPRTILCRQFSAFWGLDSGAGQRSWYWRGTDRGKPGSARYQPCARRADALAKTSLCSCQIVAAVQYSIRTFNTCAGCERHSPVAIPRSASETRMPHAVATCRGGPALRKLC